jgi:hypothetical protein
MSASRRPRPSRECAACTGGASIEFVVAVMVVLPLVLAIVEFAQLAVARHALNHGVFEAARAAAMQDGSAEVVRRQLARAMMPLFAPPAPGERTPGLASGVEGTVIAAAELLRPDLASITLLEPDSRPLSGGATANAPVLVVRVRYCRELIFPWHAGLWPAWAGMSVFDLGCRARGRLPIESLAAVHMQPAAADQPSAPP